MQCAGKGHQWWVRDVHHISADNGDLKTLCGRKMPDYLVIGTMAVTEAVKDHGLCEKCKMKAAENGR